jgi:hypothetical protein
VQAFGMTAKPIDLWAQIARQVRSFGTTPRNAATLLERRRSNRHRGKRPD